MTEVHIRYRRLDRAAPVVLVEVEGTAYAAVDSDRREAATDMLDVLLLARYGPGGWSVKTPPAA